MFKGIIDTPRECLLSVNEAYRISSEIAYKSWQLDPVVDRVEHNDRLGCFVDRLNRLYPLVDDFTTRLDFADFRLTWSTCGHVDHSFLLVLAYCMATDAKKFCVQSPDAFPVPSGRPSFPF